MNGHGPSPLVRLTRVADLRENSSSGKKASVHRADRWDWPPFCTFYCACPERQVPLLVTWATQGQVGRQNLRDEVMPPPCQLTGDSRQVPQAVPQCPGHSTHQGPQHRPIGPGGEGNPCDHADSTAACLQVWQFVAGLLGNLVSGGKQDTPWPPVWLPGAAPTCSRG